MRLPTIEHFWRSILLSAVYIVHVTSALSGTHTLSADTPIGVPYKDHITYIRTNPTISKTQRRPLGYNSMEIISTEAISYDKRVPDILKDANQSYGEGKHNRINNAYSYVLQKNTVNHTVEGVNNVQSKEYAESFLLHDTKSQPFESSNHHEVFKNTSKNSHEDFKNTSKNKLVGTGTGLQLKVRLARSAQGENKDGNITNTESSSDTLSEVVPDISNIESNVSSSTDISATIPQNIPHKPAIVNSTYQSESSDEMTTTISNIIPREPVLRNMAFAQHEPMLTKEDELQPSLKESTTPFHVDNSNMIDSLISTILMSSDSNLNEIVTESVHASDSQPTAFNNILLPSQGNTNSQGGDVPAKAGDLGSKLNRKLSQGPKDGQKPEPRESGDDTLLEISLSSNGDSMVVNWLFVSNKTQVSGFQVSYRMNDREDFDSSSLDISVRSFALHSLHEDENYVICVHAMVNNTAVRSSCAEWSKSSMKMVVGILAGTIFLIPCIIVMALILYKDYKMKQKNRLQEINDEIAAGKRQLISCKNTPLIHLQSYHDEVKGVEDEKADGKTRPTEASLVYSSPKSLSRSIRDTGHENPCEHAADDSTDDDDIRGPWQRLSKQEVDMAFVPLQDELLSNSPAASISSKNNITYIMIRSNSGTSSDQIVHQITTNTDNQSPFQDPVHL